MLSNLERIVKSTLEVVNDLKKADVAQKTAAAASKAVEKPHANNVTQITVDELAEKIDARKSQSLLGRVDFSGKTLQQDKDRLRPLSADLYVFSYYLEQAETLGHLSSTDPVKLKKAKDNITIYLKYLNETALKMDLQTPQLSPEEHLKKAIEDDDIALFEASIARGADINKKTDGAVPIVSAANKNTLTFLRRLLELPQLNVNTEDIEGHKALSRLMRNEALFSKDPTQKIYFDITVGEMITRGATGESKTSSIGNDSNVLNQTATSITASYRDAFKAIRSGSQKSTLAEPQIDRIQHMIGTLKKEVDGSNFLNFNKDRKNVKIEALEALLKHCADGVSVKDAVIQVQTKFPSATMGKFSTRTADLLNDLAGGDIDSTEQKKSGPGS